ncbi:hypothetical protein M2397_004793 [Pseudomonas sp. BIGb0381]|uniref:hypothetical protein n=1 Tax=Pseudomonas TaxID=286 RepID=UPI0021678770|nr:MULTISPECIES: hypothetical protein [Pseudomonas]MCS4314473.1 hypothetical protein [Pseudomonas sp. BIGb0381]
MSEGILLDLVRLTAVDEGETVARALYPPEWDEAVRRGSPGCFKRNNTSVTRNGHMKFDQLLARLKSDVERPGSGVLIRAIGLITVGNIKEIGRANPKPVHFEVWEKATDGNPDHAEISPYDCAAQAHPNKTVPRGLSSQLSKALSLVLVTPDGEIEALSPPVL